MARVVIGLDFGTTYTGVAYCDHNGTKEGEIRLISQWPCDTGNTNQEKVPSRIAYEQPPKDGVIWGNQISWKCKLPVHACMKLQLDEKSTGSTPLDELIEFLTRVKGLESTHRDDAPPAYPGHSGKSSVDIIGDYLSKVRETTYKEMTKSYGEKLLGSMSKELVITVPAVWSERAKDLTYKAVSRAGFGANKIMMVTEPEAAAVYTLKGMAEGVSKADIKVGDVFVLCDAGGGTVDLISYKITRVDPYLEVEEAAVGSGDKCGASYIDKEFLVFLEEWIGTAAFKKIKPEKTRHGSELMNAFEQSKFSFKGEDDTEAEIRLPSDCGIANDEDLNIDDYLLTLNAAQMRKIFDPCINRTLELIDGQVSSVMKAKLGKPKMVLVVGGFGRNEYLYGKVVDYCRQRGIETRQPLAPWSAVARGAVCRGLEGVENSAITIRLARKFYGTPASEPYISGLHDERDMYVDELTGRKMARGQMTWLCDKGSRLPERSPKTMSISVCRHFTADDDDRTCTAVLVGCEEDEAPQRFAEDGA